MKSKRHRGRQRAARPVEVEDWRRQRPVRRHARPRARPGRSARPISFRIRLAVLFTLVELCALVWLLASPAFRPQQPERNVRGVEHLSANEVTAAAGLDGSVYGLDGDGIRQRLIGLPWIRDAQVEIRAPNRVLITVEEWEPVAAYRPAGGHSFFVNELAIATGPAPAGPDLLRIEGPSGSDPKPGHQALDPELLRHLVNIERAFPRLVGQGQTVREFQFDRCFTLVLTTRRGWQVDFGGVATPEDLVALNDKMRNLAAYASTYDLNSPQLRSIKLQDPSGVTVEEAPPAPKPTPGAKPAPSPAPAAPEAVLPCR